MISSKLKERGIDEALHFTTNRGLVGSLAKGYVLSRARLPREDYLSYILHNNSKVRPEASVFFDKSEDWLDFVNLSISEINRRFFNFSSSWDHNADRWWSILSFEPEILTHEGVRFTTTNNGYEGCLRGSGAESFDALFGDRIHRKGNWFARRGLRAAHLPTCEQAEALYPGQLSIEHLRRIYVRDAAESDRAKGWLREFGLDHVTVEIDPRKFEGAPN